jgi:hypothetical protein
MSEIAAGFARDWVEFTDPNDDSEIFKCDLTWLTSNWSCIYGSGCKGVFADQPNAGCCTEGAMYSDAADEAKVMEIAKKLTPDMWQFFDEAHSNAGKGKKTSLNISEVDEDNERKTRTVNGSCIFLNRKGEFPTFGCVLHHFAEQNNLKSLEVKPDVCWQLPIRRSFEKREVGEREYSVTVIGEYERLAWGDGGEDFDWYCSSDSDAHVGTQPVYLSNAAELKALMGLDNYSILKEICDQRIAGIKLAEKKRLPLFVIQHPATVAAKR